jgi:hypothetical protein
VIFQKKKTAMVRIVTFSRNTVTPPPALMGMLPAVNQYQFLHRGECMSD